jgi:hypothetical protein
MTTFGQEGLELNMTYQLFACAGINIMRENMGTTKKNMLVGRLV